MKFKNTILSAVLSLLAIGQGLGDTTTTRAGITKPSIGSTGWGVKWNTNADTIDAGFAVLATTNSFTQPQYFSAGSVSAPSISFANQTGTGLYERTSTTLDIAYGGVRYVEFDASGSNWAVNALPISNNGAQLGDSTHNWLTVFASTFQSASNGTAALPSYGFSGSSGIGMYLVGSNTLGFSAGSTLFLQGGSSGASILGTNTNDNAPSGYYGELASTGSFASALAAPASTNWGDLVSTTVAAGDWDFSANMQLNASGSANVAYEIAISSVSGNSATNIQLGDNAFLVNLATATTGSACIPSYRMTFTAATTVYLKQNATYASGTPSVKGRLRARRVR